MKKIRTDWFVLSVVAIIAVSGCGGGCDSCGMEPIPGGFNAQKRTGEAVQVRITPTGLAKITADPAGVIGPLVGDAMNGKINFPVPASCGGDTEICCVNNMPAATCGPLEIDMVQRNGDAARLAVDPKQGASTIDMTIRARVKTKMNLPITYQGIDCDVSLDTMRDNTPPDLRIDATLAFTQDAAAGTTRVEATTVAVSQLDAGDVQLSGGFLCILGGAAIGASEAVRSQSDERIREPTGYGERQRFDVVAGGDHGLGIAQARAHVWHPRLTIRMQHVPALGLGRIAEELFVTRGAPHTGRHAVL